MNAQAVAVIIAGALTVIGTLAVQYFGHRATTKQLDQTLGEQRARTLNERFATAASQLGGDKPPAIRLAGVYAMAGLADDWPENRQTCVDVLCAHLRMPYYPDPGQDAPEGQRLAYRANLEVRLTVIRVITAHLKDGAAVSWQGLNFDFTGAVFDGGDFRGAEFSGGEVLFAGAKFTSGTVSFAGARFDSTVDFTSARFFGSWVSFNGAKFAGGEVKFPGAQFSGGEVLFANAQFSGSEVSFDQAQFSAGEVSFVGAQFSAGEVSFVGAQFSGGKVDFSGAADWSFPPVFSWTGPPPAGVILPDQEDQSRAQPG
jgi:hypothetical protein